MTLFASRCLLPIGLCLLAACSGSPKSEKTTNQVATPPPIPTSANARQLVLAATAATLWNGVTVSDDDRIFVVFPHNEGNPGTRIGEVKNGRILPYPNRAWNAWQKEGDPAKTAFVRANSLRFGPDGLLWVVDSGTPKSDAPPIADGPKLLAIDITKNQVVRTIPLDKLAKHTSMVNDLRFHGDMIYLTDSGAPGLILLNQKTGQGRRVLDGNSSTTARRPMLDQGRIMRKPDGSHVAPHADQLEVSPDGRYCYFQAAPGPMYRVETKYLDNPATSSADIARQVRYFFNSPSCGGTTIDAEGNLYISDLNEKRVLKVTPTGQSSTLVQSPALVWVDAMWIDHAGNLWLPIPQMNRTAGFQQGVETVQLPYRLYKLPIGARR